jgi:hydroxypyruvate isomerase
MSLNLSAPDWCFYKSPYKPDDYYRTLAKIGYTGAEMVDPARWPSARAAGLSIINMSAPGMTVGINKRENHPSLIPEIVTTIGKAGNNGIPQVIVFSGNRNGQDRAAGLANCIDALKHLVPHAQKHRVTLAFEMLNSFDHPDYMADDSEFGFEIVRAVASPHVKVLYDIYHMHRMGEDIMRDLADNLPYISHLHIAGSPRRDFPGADQRIDYEAIVKLMTARGYQGSWGMEFIPAGDPLSELKEAARLFQSSAGL